MSSRPAARRNKWVAPVLIALVCARMLDITDGSLTTPSSTSHHSEQKTEEQPVNGDFLAMSDVYTSSDTDNATLSSSYSKNFRVSRSEFNGVCANGECGGADVLRVVSQLAKRILGDPRVLGLRTGVPHSADNEDEAQAADEQSARAVGGGTSFDTRPFSSGDYYYDSNNYRNREGASDSYAMASNGNYRNRDRYANDASSSASYTDGQLASSNAYDRDGGYDSYGGDSYGGDGGYSGGGYDSYCCGQNNKLFPIFLVGLLGLLAFFLYLRSTTTTAAGRSGGLDDNDLSDGNFVSPQTMWIGSLALEGSRTSLSKIIDSKDQSYFFCIMNSVTGRSYLVELGPRAVGARWCP